MEEFKSIGEELGIDKPVSNTTTTQEPPPDQNQDSNQDQDQNTTTDSASTSTSTTDSTSEPPKDFLSAFEAEMRKTNPEFKLDEKVSEKSPLEQIAYVKDHLQKTSFSADLANDPFIQSYVEAKKNGIPAQTFMEQNNLVETIKNMPSRDFLIRDLQRQNGKSEKNPDGWTTEDIEAHVDSMNKIDMDLKAQERKESIYNGIKQENSAYLQKQKDLIKQESETANSTVIKETVDKLFNDMADIKDIGGIPHTAEDQAAFKQMFTDAVSINPETGYPRTRELFNDDKVLYEVLYLYNKIHNKGEGSLRNFLSTFKEEYKQEILDKTRVSPRKEGGGFNSVKIPVPGDFV